MRLAWHNTQGPLVESPMEIKVALSAAHSEHLELQPLILPWAKIEAV